jgi:hypothetical protein
MYMILRGRIIDVNYKDPVNPGPDTTIFKCWKSVSITSILIGSSEKLSQDVISQQPTASTFRCASQQLGVLYSINVKQYALSEQAYRFLQQLKRNTEQLGTIFDAQPSDNNGNIRCITNAQEPVIGFVEVSEEKTKRIFISNTQVPGWKYAQKCEDEIKVMNLPDSLTQVWEWADAYHHCRIWWFSTFRYQICFFWRTRMHGLHTHRCK